MTAPVLCSLFWDHHIQVLTLTHRRQTLSERGKREALLRVFSGWGVVAGWWESLKIKQKCFVSLLHDPMSFIASWSNEGQGGPYNIFLDRSLGRGYCLYFLFGKWLPIPSMSVCLSVSVRIWPPLSMPWPLSFVLGWHRLTQREGTVRVLPLSASLVSSEPSPSTTTCTIFSATCTVFSMPENVV